MSFEFVGELLFRNGEKHIKVENGVDKDYVIVGVVQDQNTGMFHVLMKYGDVPECISARNITPTIRELKEPVFSKIVEVKR